VRRYSLTGNDRGLTTTYLAYAYSYGDGGKVSCENLCEAVSLLMGGIPIREYIVTNQDSMPYINNLAGGITVTVPNDDLEELYPEFSKGRQVTLTDENIETFLRYRDITKTFSNEGRMERQKAYITAYIEKVQQMDLSQIVETWDALEEMEDYLQTSITKNKYLDLAEYLQAVEFTGDNYEQLEGTEQEGELHDEFYPDEEALQEEIIKLFYIKV
jgi:anionic cell wall polymer biosynthesis LytR-Cps2A-Psr (LCP) family protein